MSITLCNEGHIPIAFADTDRCPACNRLQETLQKLQNSKFLMQNKLGEALFEIEMLENTISYLNQRIAFLES